MIARPTLSISLAGLSPREDAPWGQTPRDAIGWAATMGFRSVRLDARALRARDLDRSARRDVASLLKRLSLSCGGLDLWIPPSHYADSATADRAASAAIAGAELAAELGLLGVGAAITVSVTFPETAGDGPVRHIADRAGGIGVAIADHAYPLGPLSSTLAREPGSSLGIGIDPAAVLMGGGDPGAEASRAGNRLASARLSDASALGRVAPGQGRLDELAYLVSLATAGYPRDVALDLRNLPDQEQVARATLARWQGPAA